MSTISGDKGRLASFWPGGRLAWGTLNGAWGMCQYDGLDSNGVLHPMICYWANWLRPAQRAEPTRPTELEFVFSMKYSLELWRFWNTVSCPDIASESRMLGASAQQLYQVFSCVQGIFQLKRTKPKDRKLFSFIKDRSMTF